VSEIAEVPPGHVAIAGTVAQLHAAEGVLPPASWLAGVPSLPLDAEGQIFALLYSDADAPRVASRVLPGGAAVLAPGTRVSVRQDAFGRWAVDALDPAGVALVLTADGAAGVAAMYGTSGTSGTDAGTATGVGLSRGEMARGACAWN